MQLLSKHHKAGYVFFDLKSAQNFRRLGNLFEVNHSERGHTHLTSTLTNKHNGWKFTSVTVQDRYRHLYIYMHLNFGKFWNLGIRLKIIIIYTHTNCVSEIRLIHEGNSLLVPICEALVLHLKPCPYLSSLLSVYGNVCVYAQYFSSVYVCRAASRRNRAGQSG